MAKGEKIKNCEKKVFYSIVCFSAINTSSVVLVVIYFKH